MLPIGSDAEYEQVRSGEERRRCLPGTSRIHGPHCAHRRPVRTDHTGAETGSKQRGRQSWRKCFSHCHERIAIRLFRRGRFRRVSVTRRMTGRFGAPDYTLRAPRHGRNREHCQENCDHSHETSFSISPWPNATLAVALRVSVHFESGCKIDTHSRLLNSARRKMTSPP